MRFDFIVGNPPYQEEMEGTSDDPIFDSFMDEAYRLANIVELITKGGFLFGAGKTGSKWNEKMLADPHLKVLSYEPDARKVFPMVGFKGGVAVTYRDASKQIGPIGQFVPHKELASVRDKAHVGDEYLNAWVKSPESFRFTPIMHEEHPEAKSRLSAGHANDVVTNIFEKLDNIVFFEEKPAEGSYVEIIGLLDGKRTRRWIDERYLRGPDNFDRYRVLLPKANDRGGLGDVLSYPFVGHPKLAHTQTFISIGSLDTEAEAENLLKYLKGKFARALLATLKSTPDNKARVWGNIPVQDFSPDSDIDWSRPISEIDQQLYEKYQLTDEEIEFVESNVKEMI